MKNEQNPAEINSDREPHPGIAFARRIVALEDEVSGTRIIIRGIYNEAKEEGHLKGSIREVVRRLREEPDQRASREAIEAERDQMLASIGMLDGKPLSEAVQAAFDLGMASGSGQAANGAFALDEDNGPTPYEAGRQAYRAGLTAGLNPYLSGGAEHEAWGDGWTAEFATRLVAINDGSTKPRRGRPRKSDGAGTAA